MEFFTKIDIPNPDFSLDYGTPVAFFGSCFADSISEQFLARKFQVLSNPFGTVYNPLSIARQIRAIAAGKVFTEEDIFQDSREIGGEACGLWHCWDAHGSLSAHTKEECIDKLNTAANQARKFLQKADTVFITLGTAFVYFLNASDSATGGRVVANCHRQDPKLFTRRMISVEEAAEALTSIVNDLHSINSKLHIVFTVSPLRHMADGAHENSLSKATLMLAIDKAPYFPSYEIVMDELRDYRFYDSDMVHLSKTAEQIIFERMVECYCDDTTRGHIAKVEKFLKMTNHRIVDANSPATTKFIEKLRREAEQLEAQIPGLNLEKQRRPK
ncbi:MAG: GSCFA domain-containing protein [Fibrobacter sp.]|nr:GSCFA domain-containing protein [Fibrobacter sp.]